MTAKRDCIGPADGEENGQHLSLVQWAYLVTFIGLYMTITDCWGLAKQVKALWDYVACNICAALSGHAGSGDCGSLPPPPPGPPWPFNYFLRHLESASNPSDWMDLPDHLKEALLFARTITTRSAGKRQRKYIGRLMRSVDIAPIIQILDEVDEEHTLEAQNFQDLERLRDDLVEGNQSALDDLLDRYPHADRQRLMQLVRSARKEKEQGRPPKNYRLLFAYLRELTEMEHI